MDSSLFQPPTPLNTSLPSSLIHITIGIRAESFFTVVTLISLFFHFSCLVNGRRQSNLSLIAKCGQVELKYSKRIVFAQFSYSCEASIFWPLAQVDTKCTGVLSIFSVYKEIKNEMRSFEMQRMIFYRSPLFFVFSPSSSILSVHCLSVSVCVCVREVGG